MRVIHRPRGAGKTHGLVLWLEKMKEEKPHSHPIILTISMQEAERIQREYQLREDEVMFFKDYIRKFRHHNDVIAIDNAEMVLQQLIPKEIDTITISETENEKH